MVESEKPGIERRCGVVERLMDDVLTRRARADDAGNAVVDKSLGELEIFNASTHAWSHFPTPQSQPLSPTFD